MSGPNYSYQVKAGSVPFFETPVGHARLAGAEPLIGDLRSAIETRMAEHPGLKRSNHLGWHSDTSMLAWGGAAARKLSDTAVQIARRMSSFKEATVEDYDWVVSMWANVSPPGALNQLHVHPANLWAAVFYIDIGAEPGEDCGGELFFEDPRFPMAAMHNTAFRLVGVDGRQQDYQPNLSLAAGDIVVFPAWLRHGVRPFRGTRDRISIAMNIDAKDRRGRGA
jgi:uncharacterized protein (TIGR02466 family)